MKNSRTFGEALDYVSKHAQAHSLASRLWLKRLPEEKAVLSGHDILLDRLPHRSQAVEQLLLVGHLAAMEITGGQARVRRVHFRHQPVSPAKVYRRYFGCQVRFGQNEDGVVFFDRDLAAPIIDPDSQVYEQATAFIDAQFAGRRPPLSALARGVIMQLLGGEACDNDRVAAELNLHARTLHRRLRAEGASFRQIKDEVRRDLMLYYLQDTDLEFARISDRLGFAEQSVMTRSCNRWFGTSPTRLRAAGRGFRPPG
jgi:AraC-like DNA-binding protein